MREKKHMRTTITLRKDQAEWIKKKKGFKLSRFVQECLDKEIYVDARVWKITGGGTDYKIGTHLRFRREEWEKLPSNRLGKYIEKGGARYYLKEMIA